MKDLYLGRYNSPESKEEHRRIVAIVSKNGGIYPSSSVGDVSVAEALVGFVGDAEKKFRDPEGKPTRGLEDVKRFSRLLRTHSDVSKPVVELTASQVECVRNALSEKYVRTQVNKFMVQLRIFAKWLFLHDHIELEQREKIKAVSGLRTGQSGVKEGKGRKAADPTEVEKVVPHLPPMLGVAVQIIRWTGARPQEILSMKVKELDDTDDIWKFFPEQQKGTWRNRKRVICIGQTAQKLLAPLICGLALEEYVFSPKRSEEARNAERSAKRKTPRWPSHMVRNQQKRVGPKTKEFYTIHSACRALKKACEKAGVKGFTLYELRHLRATELVEWSGVDVARAALGHAHQSTTLHYSKGADLALAERAATIEGPELMAEANSEPVVNKAENLNL